MRQPPHLFTRVDRIMMAVLLLVLAVVPFHMYGFELAVGGIILLLFLWSVRVALEKRITIVWSPLQWVLLGLLAFCVVQFVPLPFAVRHFPFGQSASDMSVELANWPVITFDPLTTTNAAIALATVIGYLFVTLSLLNTQWHLRLLLNWLTAIGFIISLLWLLNRLSVGDSPLLAGAFPLGFFFREFDYAGFLDLILPLPVAMIFTRGIKRDQSILYGFAAVVISVALVTAGLTGGVLVLVLEMLILTLLVARQREKLVEGRRARSMKMWRVVSFATMTVGLVAGVIWTSTRPLSQVVSSDVMEELPGIEAVQGDPVERSYYTRLVIWQSTIQVFADNPIFGVGFGALPVAYTGYDPAPGLKEMNAAHNDYLQLLAETGVVGGILLVLFLVFLFRVSRDSLFVRTPLGRSVALGASVGCFGILVHSLVDFFLQSFMNAFVFLILVAMLLSVRRLEKRGEFLPGESSTGLNAR